MKVKTIVALLVAGFSSTTLAQTASDELKLSNHLNQIKAPAAWASSTGAGVLVGVVDSGVTINNPDLFGQVVVAPNTNFIAGAKNDIRDLNGHGTHVSGIIGAARNKFGMVGVAPDARIIPVRVASAGGGVSLSALGQGIRRAADLAPIINVSIGGPACCTNDIKYAVGRGALIVAAAGNNGQASPIWPAAYAKEAWTNGQLIAVGAVDQSNNITSWSNRAGAAKNHFLVAPGAWILSTKGIGLAYMSGTSMAAPQVTGAAVLVKSRWSYLRADQIAEILFRSATDLGAPGIDPVYGRGLLNAEQALRPIGMTFVVNSRGTIVSAKLTQIAPSSAYSAAVKNTKIQSIELDEFGRDFNVDLRQYVVTAPDRTLSKLLEQNFDQVTAGQQVPSMSVNFANNKISAGILGSGLNFMQLDSANKNIVRAATLMSNPAINLVSDNNHIGLTHNLGHGLQFKAAAFTTAGADQLNNQTKSKSHASAVAVSFTKQNTNSSLGLTVTTLKESDKFLGGGMSGFSMSGAPNLTFITAEAAIELASNTAAFVQFTQAKSDEGASAAGFAATVSRAQAIKLGVVQSNVVKRNDQLTMTVKQPLKVAAGKLSANLPVGRDETGQLMFENKVIDLAAPGHETQIKFDYVVPVKKQTHARAFLQFNHNPAHDAAAKTQSVFGLQFFVAF